MDFFQDGDDFALFGDVGEAFGGDGDAAEGGAGDAAGEG